MARSKHANSERSHTLNPNNPAQQAAPDNHSDQLRPMNSAYASSRAGGGVTLDSREWADHAASPTREMFRREFSASREAAVAGLDGGSIGHMELYLRERTPLEIRELIGRFAKAGPHVESIAQRASGEESLEALREVFWSMILEDFMKVGSDSHAYMEHQWLPAYGPEAVKAKVVPDRRLRRQGSDDDEWE